MSIICVPAMVFISTICSSVVHWALVKTVVVIFVTCQIVGVSET